jgi:hypothetical protein
MYDMMLCHGMKSPVLNEGSTVILQVKQFLNFVTLKRKALQSSKTPVLLIQLHSIISQKWILATPLLKHQTSHNQFHFN